MNAKISGDIVNNRIVSTRTSGTTDIIPIDIPIENCKGVTLIGEVRAVNTPDRHLKIYFQVDSILHQSDTLNEVNFEGYICKTPATRTTPKGKIITDLIVAVNRPDYTSDYIPCVLWGNAPTLSIGNKVKITGRIQSRIYHETETAYEISIRSIEVIF